MCHWLDWQFPGH